MLIPKTLVIAAPIDRVWDVLDDERNLPKWMPQIVGTTYPRGRDSRRAVGAPFVLTMREGGKTKDYAGAITAYEPRRRLAIRLDDQRFSVEATYRLSPADADGHTTRLDYTSDMTCRHWLMRTVTTLTRPFASRYLDKHLGILKTLCEMPSPPMPPSTPPSPERPAP